MSNMAQTAGELSGLQWAGRRQKLLYTTLLPFMLALEICDFVPINFETALLPLPVSAPLFRHPLQTGHRPSIYMSALSVPFHVHCC